MSKCHIVGNHMSRSYDTIARYLKGCIIKGSLLGNAINYNYYNGRYILLKLKHNNIIFYNKVDTD